MSHADAIIAISQSTARDVRALGAQAPIHIIPHGINIAQFTSVVRPEDTRTLEQLGVQKPYVLFLATCEPRKNLPSLVEAFDRIAHAHPHLQLVIAGGHGWKRRVLDKTIASAAHRARIRQTGFVKDDVRATLLRHAACLCLPSRYEGFGMQMLEAFACKTPVIASNNSSMTEVGEDAALYVRAMNTHELARTIDELLKDTTLREQLTTRGIARLQTYNWRASAQKIHDILASYDARGTV